MRDNHETNDLQAENGGRLYALRDAGYVLRNADPQTWWAQEKQQITELGHLAEEAGPTMGTVSDPPPSTRKRIAHQVVKAIQEHCEAYQMDRPGERGTEEKEHLAVVGGCRYRTSDTQALKTIYYGRSWRHYNQAH